MIHAYHVENPMIDSTQFPNDLLCTTECKQCGTDFEPDCFSDVEQEFCSIDCADMHAGIAIETETK